MIMVPFYVPFVTSFALAVATISWFIKLSPRFFVPVARDFVPQTHAVKAKTPSMGGLPMLVAAIVSMFAWCFWDQYELWLVAATLVLFGAIGLLDDVCKAWYKKGISPRLKFRLQLICSAILAMLLFYLQNPLGLIFIPFSGGLGVPVGLLFIPWAMLVLVGTSNAVNLTDGLDGLAAGILLLNFLFFALCATQSAIIIACLALSGACCGFLWFNWHPAKIFMGDVGSLSLGAALAMIALTCRMELYLIISGVIFVAETASVMLQIWSIKQRGKKIFIMAPLHHHFEMVGWKETKVTKMFYLITFACCLLTILLKALSDYSWYS